MSERHDLSRDPFARLRVATRARIGLGRAGDALPTAALLDFQDAHSAARDAVHGAVDFEALAQRLAPRPCLRVHSQAASRDIYLRRPDLGRRVRAEDLPALDAARGDWDLAIVVADGLSAAAIERQAVPLIEALSARVGDGSLAPIVLAEQARVAIGDEVAERLGARMVALLVGERPGLSVSDSLGIYLTWQPHVGCADSARNCISNIHADGLSHEEAAETLMWLMIEARRRRLSGVSLKLDRHDEGAIEG